MISFVVKIIKGYLFNKRIKKAKAFMRADNAHLLDGFSLSVLNPENNKIYLVVGNDSTLTCSITFESPGGNVTIGERSFIGSSHIICRCEVGIENDVFIAWGCSIYDHDSHSVDYREREKDIQRQLADLRSGRNFIESKDWSVINSKPIKICSNAWIGMNCIILKGVTIGEGAIVGAGSVVTKDVAPWTIVGGNPARFLKEVAPELRKK